MKSLLPYFFFFVLLGNTSLQAQTNSLTPDIIKACKDARDFQGCANSFKGVQTTNTQGTSTAPEECNDEVWCIAKAGKDNFGLSKVVGWSYKSTDNGIHV